MCVHGAQQQPLQYKANITEVLSSTPLQVELEKYKGHK